MRRGSRVRHQNVSHRALPLKISYRIIQNCLCGRISDVDSIFQIPLLNLFCRTNYSRCSNPQKSAKRSRLWPGAEKEEKESRERDEQNNSRQRQPFFLCAVLSDPIFELFRENALQVFRMFCRFRVSSANDVPPQYFNNCAVCKQFHFYPTPLFQLYYGCQTRVRETEASDLRYHTAQNTLLVV